MDCVHIGFPIDDGWPELQNVACPEGAERPHVLWVSVEVTQLFRPDALWLPFPEKP